jgi:hypothetical protein
MAQKLAKPLQNSSSSNSSSSDGGGVAATTFFSGHNMKKIPLKQNKNCPYLFYPCPNESACFCFPQAGWMKFTLVPSIQKLAFLPTTLLLSVRS